MHNPAFLFMIFLVIGCGSDVILHELPMRGKNGIAVVVETPAGAVREIHYDPAARAFEADPGKVDFLPFPGNWGFVPSTRIPYQKGKSFAPVAVLVLGEPLESGRVVEVRPVAAAILSEKGKRSVLVLATPLDSVLCNMEIRDYPDLVIGHSGVRESLEQWLRQRKGTLPVEVLDWKDGQFALRFIQASSVRLQNN